ncbi:MAG: CHC2 zinc finger domain-containing protein [Salinibacter sp.]
MSDDREYVDFKKLKAKISMHDLLDHYDLTGQMEQKSEDTLVGPCPITGSESQAFKVNEDKGVWYSFALEGDGAGGNILDFVARMEDTDVLGAANLIDEWFDKEGASADEESKPTSNTSSEEPEEKAALPDPLDENAHTDAFDSILRMCGEEIAALENETREEIEDVLDREETEDLHAESIAERLGRWIRRAYRRGYKLGKMQGAIEERISRLK